MLTVDTMPLETQASDRARQAFQLASRAVALLRFLMARVLTAPATELAEFQTLSGRLLVFRRHVVAAFAHSALQHNIIAGHKSPSRF